MKLSSHTATTTFPTMSHLLAARAEGLSIRETARAAGVSIGKAHGVIKEAEAETADAADWVALS